MVTKASTGCNHLVQLLRNLCVGSEASQDAFRTGDVLSPIRGLIDSLMPHMGGDVIPDEAFKARRSLLLSCFQLVANLIAANEANQEHVWEKCFPATLSSWVAVEEPRCFEVVCSIVYMLLRDSPDHIRLCSPAGQENTDDADCVEEKLQSTLIVKLLESETDWRTQEVEGEGCTLVDMDTSVNHTLGWIMCEMCLLPSFLRDLKDQTNEMGDDAEYVWQLALFSLCLVTNPSGDSKVLNKRANDVEEESQFIQSFITNVAFLASWVCSDTDILPKTIYASDESSVRLDDPTSYALRMSCIQSTCDLICRFIILFCYFDWLCRFSAL